MTGLLLCQRGRDKTGLPFAVTTTVAFPFPPPRKEKQTFCFSSSPCLIVFAAVDVLASFEARRLATKDAFYQTTKKIMEEMHEESSQQWEVLQQGWEEMREEQATMFIKYGGGKEVKGDDVLELNVGGQTMDIKRSLLTQLGDTRLAAVFSGRWDKRLPRDRKNRWV